MKIIAFSILALLSQICLTPISFAMEKVKLASLEYPPYTGNDLKNQGFITAIVKASFKEVGLDISVRFLPWARALDSAKNGKFDGLFTIWKRKEREEWFVFSDELPANEIALLKLKKDNIKFKKMEDLKPYKIGTVRGYADPDEFNKATYLRKEKVKNDKINIRKLMGGRIQLVLTDKYLAEHIINTDFSKQKNMFDWLSPSLKIDPQYIAFSKKSPRYKELLERFNRGLQEIKKKKIYQKIMKEHGFE